MAETDLYRWVLGIALNHYPEAPKAQTVFHDAPTRRQIINLALKQGLVGYDDLHHAPACAANNWSKMRFPEGPCTCGAQREVDLVAAGAAQRSFERVLDNW